MLNSITYYLVYCWMYLHALLPFRALYVLSDIFYFFVYHVVGYRLKTVRKNLRNAFPFKPEKELLKLEKEFYRNFCDYFVETIKLLHISDKQMQQRMRYKNIDVIDDMLKKGNSCIVCLGHYCNWEWVPSITLMFNKNVQLAQIYKHLRNKAFDRIFLKIRSRFGSLGIAKEDTYRAIIRMKQEEKQTVIGFIADQTPAYGNVRYWTTFLNQDTPMYTGAERIAKQTGFGVVYLDIAKTGRGRYVGECKLITDAPKSEPEYAITERYVHLFEETILREPAHWLWSHNRWKHKKEDFTQ